jgi:hypothetical protein
LTTTSRGRRVPNDRFPHEVARVVREAAERSLSSFGSSPFLDNHVHTLNELADLVLSVGLEDQRVRSLALVQAFSGSQSDTWNPGEEATGFIASAGLGPATPTADESLAELVSFAIEDLANALGVEVKRGRRGLKRAAELEAANETMATERKLAAEREERLNQQLGEARERESKLVAQANHLKRALAATSQHVPTDKGTKAKADQPKPPRRVRVEGPENEGIYTVTRKVGPNDFDTALEIGFKDAAGKQRWRRLEHTDIEKARAERAELHHTKEPAAA